MASEAAMLLDQLMGTTRNALPGENVKELNWSDEEVCKNFICGFCPSELFINTKAEAAIGPCFKVHDDRLKRAYEESMDKGECGYEDMFLAHLERLVRDLDRKVERGKERLRRSAQAKQQSLHGDGPDGCSSERLKQLNADIEMLVKELQHLGELGRVEETHELMMKLENLEKERESERMTLSNSAPKVLAGFELDSNDFHEKMELCDVCGSFLVIGDTQSRVDAHLLGKQHIGFARIRTAIADLKVKKEEKFKAKQKDHGQDEQDGVHGHRRHSSHGNSREGRGSHRSYARERSYRGSSPSHNSRRRYSRSKDRRKSYSRDERSRSRDRRRSRSRSWGKRRSRSRSRGKRESRSHSRGRVRSHSQSRDKRHKPRDKRGSDSDSKGIKKSCSPPEECSSER